MSKKPKHVKIALVGSGGVGKSTLASRLVTGDFVDTSMTVGISVETWTIEEDASGDSYKAVAFDLGGQQQFRFFQESMIQGAKIALIVFDVSRFETLMGLDEWIEMTEGIPSYRRILVGNKLDLGMLIPEGEIVKIAAKWNMPWVIVSSSNGENFDDLEQRIIQAIRSIE
ncbi:MAG: GTP-binding protein [Candidatus Lokiarchaeota archaeon]|nr:GTP-binding protein [Candidatus Lokiarchaeota archaeon]